MGPLWIMNDFFTLEDDVFPFTAIEKGNFDIAFQMIKVVLSDIMPIRLYLRSFSVLIHLSEFDLFFSVDFLFF